MPLLPFLFPLWVAGFVAGFDVAHVGSLVLGIAAPAAAIWALWRVRVRVGWALPAGALVLVVATVLALSRAAVAV